MTDPKTASVFYFDLPLLIVLVSLVYGATRFESWPAILMESGRWVVRLGSFLLFIAAGLFALTDIHRLAPYFWQLVIAFAIVLLFAIAYFVYVVLRHRATEQGRQQA